jgi:hypothetical protein
LLERQEEEAVERDDNREHARKQIADNLARFRNSARRESTTFYVLLLISLVATAVPGAILAIAADPPSWIRYTGAGLAALGVFATLVESRVGTRARYKQSRSSRSKVEQLANTYAGGEMTPADAMKELNRILGEHEKARSEAIE